MITIAERGKAIISAMAKHIHKGTKLLSSSDICEKSVVINIITNLEIVVETYHALLTVALAVSTGLLYLICCSHAKLL